MPGVHLSLVTLLAILLLSPVSAGAQHRVVLAGSGGSVEAPLFSAWTEAFNRQSPAIQVGYLATSSSEGIRAVSMLSGDFASGEIPLPIGARRSNGRLEEIPLAVVGIVPVYNLPGSPQLRFTGELLAQIYMGEISRWDDNRITGLNPGASLPPLPIVLIERPDGSGTKYIFTQFLSKNSSTFRSWSKNPRPSGLATMVIGGGKAVAEKVSLTPGAIGYVDRSLAVHYQLVEGSVRNPSGKFVNANLASIYAALTAKSSEISGNFGASLVDASGAGSYPMIGFARVYIPVSGLPPERQLALHTFLTWCLQDGQALVAGQDFVPLPANVASLALAKLDSSLQGR